MLPCCTSTIVRLFICIECPTTLAHHSTARPDTGTATGITRSPLKESHAFTTIPELEMDEFSLIVSRAGDWTSNIIQSPRPNSGSVVFPQTVSLGLLPCSAARSSLPPVLVLYHVPTPYSRVVSQSTCSGLPPTSEGLSVTSSLIRFCAMLPMQFSTVRNTTSLGICLCPDTPRTTDTRKHGKPDLVKLTLETVKEFNAEATEVD